MYIIGKNQIDKQGRIIISGLFDNNSTSKIIPVVDHETEMIELLPAKDVPSFGAPVSLDEKNRIILPKWLREELGNITGLHLIIDGDKRYLSPITGNILPRAD